jgi:serine/threonine-protein kinase
MEQILANRYQIIKHLGSGGFGDTFLAQDTHLPSQIICVIKQLKPINNNPQIYQLVKERFKKEAVILEELGNHPQIPSLYAYFEEAGQFYLVQEYVEGETLSKLVETQGIQNENIVKNILIETLKILEYIESKNIIHRDIKPDNIIIRKRDKMPILIDFGAVKETMGTEMFSKGNLASSIIIGTPGYMPPEQAIGRPVFASDLYSLSLTAIYLLTGINPQNLQIDPITGIIKWQQYNSNISLSFGNILDQCIDSQVQKRFLTAKMMKDALLNNSTTPTVAPTFINNNYSADIFPTEVSSPPTIKYNKSPSLKLITFISIISVLLVSGISFIYLRNELLNRVTNINQEQNIKQNNSNLNQEQTPTPVATITPTPNNPPPVIQTYLWRSESGLTRINNLDKICQGNSILNSVQTVFGYNNSPFVGTIEIYNPQTGGCAIGSTLSGYFNLAGQGGNCVGEVTITWGNNNNAYFQWTINNLGSACPVNTAKWSINTYPVPD